MCGLSCSCDTWVGLNGKTYCNSQMSLNSAISWPERPVWFCSVAGPGSMASLLEETRPDRLVSESSTFLLQCRYFFFVFYFDYYKCCSALVVGDWGFCWTFPGICELGRQEILKSLTTLTYEAKRTLDPPAQRSCQGTSPRKDRARRYVGNLQSWLRAIWSARDETPGPSRFHSIGEII